MQNRVDAGMVAADVTPLRWTTHDTKWVQIYKVPALAKYRGQISNVFGIVAGLVAMSGSLFSLFG